MRIELSDLRLLIRTRCLCYWLFLGSSIPFKIQIPFLFILLMLSVSCGGKMVLVNFPAYVSHWYDYYYFHREKIMINGLELSLCFQVILFACWSCRDLSLNNITGQIPASLFNLSQLSHLYYTMLRIINLLIS